ncbi:hypothetical protein Y032_0840g2623 [Ancylostoma ceylanicum]|uniref:Uncharacterized protein n=1 Tax=Ancylostoma ceylanicum TaxID=53326 RepID=A0A016WBH6_9BILA|nr:hypothetical protein Y032_0840g2623 [Ancylostoma ceylanicum]
MDIPYSKITSHRSLFWKLLRIHKKPVRPSIVKRSAAAFLITVSTGRSIRYHQKLSSHRPTDRPTDRRRHFSTTSSLFPDEFAATAAAAANQRRLLTPRPTNPSTGTCVASRHPTSAAALFDPTLCYRIHTVFSSTSSG